MILETVISVLLSVPFAEKEPVDTLDSSMIVVTTKSVVPVERMSAPITDVRMAELSERGIDSPKELSAVVPNLHIPDYGSSMTSSIYLRGFGSRMENPVLGFYIDDVPVLNKNSYDMDMLDIRRATLFRGPQGTIYGRNTMCGVLALSTLSPSCYYGFRAGLEYGSANTVSARASIYRKTAKGLAIGGGVGFRHSDGFYTNSFSGEKCDPYDGISMRLRIEKSLRDDLYFENILSAGALTQGGWPYRQYLPETGELLETSYNDRCRYRRFNLTEAVKLRLEADNYTLNSISSLQVLLDRMDLDQDFTTGSMFTMAQIQREGALTQEIILKPKAHWKKEWWNWQSGVFAFWKFNRMSAPVNFKEDGIERLILGNANNNIPEDIAGGYDKPLIFKETAFPISSGFGTHTYGAAIYHESYFTFGRWMFTAGLRLDYEGSIMDYCSDASINYLFQPSMKDWKAFGIRYEGRLNDVQYLEVLPKVAVSYNIGDRQKSGWCANVFATVSKGYRSGGYNTQIFSDILQNKMMNGLMGDLGVYLDSATGELTAENTSYRPEKSWNFEVGGNLFDLWTGAGHLSASASAFCILCRDQQITIFPPGMSTGRMMANVGRSRSLGGEVSASFELKGLTLSAAYGYTDARFTSYQDGRNDYSGKRIPYSPEHTLNVRAGYRFFINSRFCQGVVVSADCSGVGRMWWDEANQLVEPFIAQLGADLRVDCKWFDLKFRMDNILNEDYNVFYFKSVGNSFFQRGKPFRWTAGISIEL